MTRGSQDRVVSGGARAQHAPWPRLAAAHRRERDRVLRKWRAEQRARPAARGARREARSYARRTTRRMTRGAQETARRKRRARVARSGTRARYMPCDMWKRRAGNGAHGRRAQATHGMPRESGVRAALAGVARATHMGDACWQSRARAAHGCSARMQRTDAARGCSSRMQRADAARGRRARAAHVHAAAKGD